MLLCVVLLSMVCGRMQVPGQLVQAPGREKEPPVDRTHAKGFLFRAGSFWLFGVSCHWRGKKAAMGWASGVSMTMTANDRMLLPVLLWCFADSRELI